MGSKGLSTVSEIRPFAAKGFYAPMTASGALLVDGAVVSAYASPSTDVPVGNGLRDLRFKSLFSARTDGLWGPLHFHRTRFVF